ncbi:heavy-metal-associated domain-containing protein [Microterricola viridarii]|uniref:Heavy metal transporter n=1 Tax=Microterricola viridarii TaxID=412690 RepID=A0A0Y0NGD4_9MICO|nr:heavy metal-associated domain-containing protein [Microterricola viridarii]AMB60481.1 heavy metal transporter [Microterricola viridarii]
MTCSHCERSIAGELDQLSGVEAIDVSAATGRLLVRSTVPLDDAAVIAAVEEAGYTAERVLS